MIDEPAEMADSENAVELCQVRGDVRLENVSFGYTKEHLCAITKHVLCSISFRIAC